MSRVNHKQSIGLALGSGSARGWAHIGVLEALGTLGLEPAVVCGSSIGALVGASYAVGTLTRLEALSSSLTRRDLVRMLDVRISAGGLVAGDRLMRLLVEVLGDGSVESLPLNFGATATDIHTGQEVWLRTGALTEVVRASIAMPGILSPVRQGGRHLVDGGLVNPVPVSLCKALGADLIIAVNINSNRVGRRTARKQRRAKTRTELFERLSADMPAPLRNHASRLASQFLAEPSDRIEFWDVLVSALNIMQEEIIRLRLQQDPPTVLIEPQVNQIGLLEFHRAAEAIEQGRAAVLEAVPQLTEQGFPILEQASHASRRSATTRATGHR